MPPCGTTPAERVEYAQRPDVRHWCIDEAPDGVDAMTGPRTARRLLATVGLVTVLVLLAGCAADANEVAGTQPDQAGFWLGLWQGFILPITFVISLFTSDVGIYEVGNSGAWYDFGFVLGALITFSGWGGGGAAASRRRR